MWFQIFKLDFFRKFRIDPSSNIPRIYKINKLKMWNFCNYLNNSCRKFEQIDPSTNIPIYKNKIQDVKFLLIIFNNSCGEKFKISLKRRDPLRNTFAYLSPSERRRGAGSSSPGVGVNRYDQPRPRYEKSTFVISRLVEFARFAVTGPSAARSPRLRLLSRGWSNAAIPKNTLELGDHLGVRLPVFVLPRRRLASSIAGPVHATLSPTGLVEKLHGPPSSRVRVQQ